MRGLAESLEIEALKKAVQAHARERERFTYQAKVERDEAYIRECEQAVWNDVWPDLAELNARRAQ